MALITCPHCGKSVSDSALKCPHCGVNVKELREEAQANKQYHLMPYGEQKALEGQFYATDGSAKRLKRKNNILLIVGWLLFILAMTATIGCLVWDKMLENDLSFTQEEYDEVVDQIERHFNNGTTNSDEFMRLADRLNGMNAEKDEMKEKTGPLMCAIVVPAAVFMIVAVVCLSIQKFGMTKERLVCAVRFREWLKTEKGILLELHPTPKQIAILEKITEEKTWL